MKFNVMKFIRKSLLVSVMLGSSAFVFNNVYAANTSTSNKTSTSSTKLTDEQAAAFKKMQNSMSTEYNEWLKSNANATQKEKNTKQQELVTKAYDSLSDSDKKLVDSYVSSMPKSSSSSSSSSSSKKTTTATSSKTASASKTSTAKTSTAKTSTAKSASSSAKTKTGDPCSISLLGMSLFGSLSTCFFYRKKL